MVYEHACAWTATKFLKKKFDDDLLKRFQITYKFCDGDIKKYCLMLEKDVYPYASE